jgi:hypothetical protein
MKVHPNILGNRTMDYAIFHHAHLYLKALGQGLKNMNQWYNYLRFHLRTMKY